MQESILRLIKQEKEQSWPILLCDHQRNLYKVQIPGTRYHRGLPTISQYNENPDLWKDFFIPYGLYEIEFNINNIRSNTEGDFNIVGFRDYDHVKVKTHFQEIFKAIQVGQIHIDNDMIRMRGRFKKTGNTINFMPLFVK